LPAAPAAHGDCCRRGRVIAGAAAGAPPASLQSTSTESDVWRSFAEAVSGEWDGISVSFDAKGEAQELPPYYVPDAFRQWVRLHMVLSACGRWW